MDILFFRYIFCWSTSSSSTTGCGLHYKTLLTSFAATTADSSGLSFPSSHLNPLEISDQAPVCHVLNLSHNNQCSKTAQKTRPAAMHVGMLSIILCPSRLFAETNNKTLYICYPSLLLSSSTIDVTM